MARAGVGFSELTNSFEAGVEAASKAIKMAKIQKECNVALLFTTTRHNPEEFHRGVTSIIGNNSKIIGGHALGTITNTEYGYDGFQTGVAVIEAQEINFDICHAAGIAFNEENAGAKLGKSIKETGKEDANMILLYDAVNRTTGKFIMNYATPFLKGLESQLPHINKLVGARMFGGMQFNPTYQWINDKIVQDHALALLISGNVNMDIVTLHGCTPSSSYHKVTKVEKGVIQELDDKPVFEVIENILGKQQASNYQDYKFFITLGMNTGGKWSEEKDSYVNRMCTGISKSLQGLIMAEPDIHEGTEVQLMRRSYEMNYVQQEIEKILNKLDQEKKSPFLGLYFNCAGRAATYSGNDVEEATYFQAAIGDRFPFLGMYEAGELTKVGDKIQVLDWTGVFCILSTPN